MKGIEWIFLISGGLTVAYMTKLYVALFIEKNSDEKIQEKYDSLKDSYMNKVSGVALTISATLLPLMGFLPAYIMEPIADLGQGILQPTGEILPMSWFSVENLKGAAISLVIGAIIYLVIVRLWLMKAEGEGKAKVYVNRWYRYLDLEDLVYRPILLKALPFVFGVICRVEK